MFRKIPTSRFHTPYDFNVAQVTSCLMESNAVWKSTKQLYTRLCFRLAFSAISLQDLLNCTSVFSKPCLFIRHILLRFYLQPIQKNYHEHFSHGLRLKRRYINVCIQYNTIYNTIQYHTIQCMGSDRSMRVRTCKAGNIIIKWDASIESKPLSA